jgi:hypothetical protein
MAQTKFTNIEHRETLLLLPLPNTDHLQQDDYYVRTPKGA